MEDGGEAGDAGFGDCFEDDFSVLEPDLRAGAVGAVWNLDAEGGVGVSVFGGDFFAGETGVVFRGFWFFNCLFDRELFLGSMFGFFLFLFGGFSGDFLLFGLED